MGLPQFMPTSVARYAIDFDGDGTVDLVHSAADAIGSVANYFKTFHWQPGLPTHFPVTFDAARLDLEALLAPDILPTFGAASFQAKGAVLDRRGAGPQRPAGAGANCKTAKPRPATWPAPRTSTPSRATTGRATTRWP